MLVEQNYTGTEAHSVTIGHHHRTSPLVISHHGKNSSKRQGDFILVMFANDSFHDFKCFGGFLQNCPEFKKKRKEKERRLA